MTQPQQQPAFATNPFDFYRTHISDVVAGITGLKASDIYPRVQRSAKFDRGDCILPVPALRLKSQKPDEAAKTVSEQEKPVVEGSSLQFFFKTTALAQLVLPDILQREAKYGRNDSQQGGKSIHHFHRLIEVDFQYHIFRQSTIRLPVAKFFNSIN